MLRTEHGSFIAADGFDQPWHIHAFALSMALCERDVLPPLEWSSRLGEAMAAKLVAEDGADAHVRAVEALERWVIERGIATTGSLDALAESWRRAAAATPHGHAIELANDPAIGR